MSTPSWSRQPYELALVALESFKLLFEHVAHVHVLGGVEAHTGQRVEVQDRRHDVMGGMLGLQERQSSDMAGVEDEPADLHMVGHVVVGRMRQDDVRLDRPDKVYYEAPLGGVSSIYFPI